MKLNCCRCGKEVSKKTGIYLMGEWSHRDCEDEYFKEQENKIKYFNTRDRFVD